ncbi:MAG: hypothetical protein AAGK37_19945 [Pseudomonadota bacterium]
MTLSFQSDGELFARHFNSKGSAKDLKVIALFYLICIGVFLERLADSPAEAAAPTNERVI